MTANQIKAAIHAALEEASAVTGDGTPLKGMIVKQGVVDRMTNPPTIGPPQEHECSVMLSEFSASERQGTNIGERDIKVLVSPLAPALPEIDGKLKISGVTYSVVRVKALQPGGAALMYQCQCRSDDA